MIALRNRELAPAFERDQRALFFNVVRETPNVFDSASDFQSEMMRMFSQESSLHLAGRKPYEKEDWSLLLISAQEGLGKTMPFDSTAMQFGFFRNGWSYMMKNKCWTCKKKCARLCTGCSVAMYCSVECQTAHWGNHKTFCKLMKTRTKANRPEGIRTTYD